MPQRSNGAAIALVSVGELFGGVERHLLSLGEYLRRRGKAEPILILFRDAELARRARAMGFPTVVLSGRGPWDPTIPFRVGRVLRERRVSLVHVHGYKAMVACSLLPRCFHVLKTEHGRPESGDGLPLATSLRSRAYHALGAWATRVRAETVVYVTADVARYYARRHDGIPSLVVHNGIDPIEAGDFSPPQEFDPAVPQLGIVGRLDNVKGIPCALRALASPRVPREAVLNVIGTGLREREYRALAESLGIGPRVRFLGFRDDVLRLTAHLTAVLMPSLHEGLPYALLEAMSLGRPVIASNVGGLAEVLVDGRTGLLLPPGDPDALAAAISDVLKDRRLALSLGAEAAREQRRAYTLDGMGDGYWRTYGRILEPRA